MHEPTDDAIILAIDCNILNMVIIVEFYDACILFPLLERERETDLSLILCDLYKYTPSIIMRFVFNTVILWLMIILRIMIMMMFRMTNPFLFLFLFNIYSLYTLIDTRCNE